LINRYLPPIALLAGLALLGSLILLTPANEALAVLFCLVLLSILAAVLYRVGIRPIDPGFPGSLFSLAFVVKLLGSVARYWMLAELYDMTGDAVRYQRAGQRMAEAIWRGDFSFLAGSLSQGSEAMEFLSGLLYTAIPGGLVTGYLVFAFLAFAGCVMMYRAFRVALPEVQPGFYRLVLFFLPSLIFWPSSLGKDAWILFGSGVVAYGTALYASRGSLRGVLVAGVGLLLVLVIRPHFAAFMVLAIGAAYLLFYRVTSMRQMAVWSLAAVLIIGLSIVVLQSATEFLNIGSLSEASWEEAEIVYAFRQRASTVGGSEFASPDVLTLVGILYAPVSVLLRPFVWEAHNVQTMVTALESLLWLCLLWWRRRIFWERVRMLRGQPWVAFCAAYAGIMILAMTTMGNFGILARQRVALLPFLWVLFA
jgi:hypothetical protein